MQKGERSELCHLSYAFKKLDIRLTLSEVAVHSNETRICLVDYSMMCKHGLLANKIEMFECLCGTWVSRILSSWRNPKHFRAMRS